MRVNGAAIRAVREAKGLSLRSLAAAVDISPAYLSRIERGQRGTNGVDPDTCHRIAAALPAPLAAFVVDNADNGAAA